MPDSQRAIIGGINEFLIEYSLPARVIDTIRALPALATPATGTPRLERGVCFRGRQGRHPAFRSGRGWDRCRPGYLKISGQREVCDGQAGTTIAARCAAVRKLSKQAAKLIRSG
jgi:hypothetical protein